MVPSRQSERVLQVIGKVPCAAGQASLGCTAMLLASDKDLPRRTSPRDMKVLVTAVPSHMLSRQSLSCPPACALIRHSLSALPVPFALPAATGCFESGDLARPLIGLAEGFASLTGDAFVLLLMSGMLLMSASDSALSRAFLRVPPDARDDRLLLRAVLLLHHRASQL